MSDLISVVCLAINTTGCLLQNLRALYNGYYFISSLLGPAVNGVSVARASQFFAPAMLLGNVTMRRWRVLQWHTYFLKNRSVGSTT